ncbi:GntP family permease [Desertibacillus haloalkaliphilus]|uniref:GntP family permease n=1 Tax=Desertibacillus haloalkaliphilus TaxID=1328930 RepID=UPI001C278173|nr:GntP family permease [Desertibacillus haloalkaliphilus]MBU8906514.1 GntP family permease [Desertibacillus haloalkaliphilus]
MLGIFLGLALIMILAYRGWSIIWMAPICAGIVAIFGGLDLLETYTGPYMEGFVNFAKTWFPVFMLGAIFGKLMEFTGMARSVAIGITKLIGPKQAILGVVIASAVLTYGGVSVFVAIFAIYPLALSLFREANLPRRLIPATFGLGAFTFTMTALPGAPQIQNLIPMEYFNTTAAAAPIMGLSAAVFMFGLGFSYLKWREKKLVQAGETYTPPKDEVKVENDGKDPHVLVSLLPLAVVVFTLNILQWDIIISLITGIVLILLFNLKKAKGFIPAMNSGAVGSVTAIINTCAAVGFGTVVQAVPAFERLANSLLSMQGNPLISLSVSTNVIAGATGSASGGLGITLDALGARYYELAHAIGMSPEAFHRIASIASGGLDALPHNGALLTLLAVTSMTHKECYKDIAVIAIAIPILSLIPAIVLASIGIY